MKIKSNNEVKTIIEPNDRGGDASTKHAASTPQASGVGSIKSAFEITRPATSLDRMLEARFPPVGTKERDLKPQSKGPRLTQDLFSTNEQGHVIVQNQKIAESLKAFSNDRQAQQSSAHPENKIWMNAGTSGNRQEAQTIISDGSKNTAADNPEARSIVEPEDLPSSNRLKLKQIIDPEDLPSVNRLATSELDLSGKVREDGSVRFTESALRRAGIPTDQAGHIINPQDQPLQKAQQEANNPPSRIK